MVPAPRGSGIVAARVPKKVLEFGGIEDVFTASCGSTKTLENFVVFVKWDDPSVIPATRELTRYIEETEELAIKGLMDNRQILDDIANESRLTGMDVQERIKKHSQSCLKILCSHSR